MSDGPWVRLQEAKRSTREARSGAEGQAEWEPDGSTLGHGAATGACAHPWGCRHPPPPPLPNPETRGAALGGSQWPPPLLLASMTPSPSARKPGWALAEVTTQPACSRRVARSSDSLSHCLGFNRAALRNGRSCEVTEVTEMASRSEAGRGMLAKPRGPGRTGVPQQQEGAGQLLGGTPVGWCEGGRLWRRTRSGADGRGSRAPKGIQPVVSST